MQYKEQKRNAPIVTLIRNYINKKSEKVSESRKEIRRRFEGLDWNHQKKIILAFLESTASDRQWAYSKAYRYWDKSFHPKVKELWERLHEPKCAWIVIQHFPVKYITQNIGMFTGKRDNYFICLRLAEDKNYVIDKSKLSPVDYLAILYHTGRTISDDEATNILYHIVIECVNNTSEQYGWERYWECRDSVVITPIEFPEVTRAIYYLTKLNCHHTIMQFHTWNEEVRQAIFSSPEYAEIVKQNLSEYNNFEAKMKVAMIYAYLFLNDKYKQPTDPIINEVLTSKLPVPIHKAKPQPEPIEPKEPIDLAALKEMVDQNPVIQELIHVFDLDTDSDVPF